MRLKNHVALITGSGSGMGRASALLFAEEGASVMVSDINDQHGAEVVDLIRKAGGKASYNHCDCSKVADMEKAVQETVATFGKLTIFWHNAGIPGPGRIDRVTEEAYDKCMDIHCKGAFFGSKFAIPEIKKAGGGSILFTSSVSGMKPSLASPVYSMSKAPLIMLAKSLAVFLGKDNIRVNCLVPGPVDTPLWPGFISRDPDIAKPEDLEKAYLTGGPVNGRLARPEEIARAALFLVSDDASYIDGATFTVDMGQSAR